MSEPSEMPVNDAGSSDSRVTAMRGEGVSWAAIADAFAAPGPASVPDAPANGSNAGNSDAAEAEPIPAVHAPDVPDGEQPKPVSKPGDVESRIKEMQAAGKSISEIARELTVPVATDSGDVDARIEELRAAGKSYGEIARELTKVSGAREETPPVVDMRFGQVWRRQG
ncbi:hypothetical protein [Spirillospora sp. CA-294931]|uniref:hypothetical protein n=1 Tax=Spirillospora sp. CA-294931 TaxID=3240042 RepID=UPI003D8A67FD